MADKKTDTEIANVPPAPTPAERVESWKEIAAYLQRDVRTVQRWEKSEALPVYRHMHDERGTVYAYKAELDAWWNNRRPRLEKEAQRIEVTRPARTTLLTRRRLWIGAATAVLVAAVGFGLWRTRPRSLPFEARDWVLITQFENRTGEAVLDGTLEYALERELSNSRFVNVVPRERVADTLRLMKKPLNTPIDAIVGREIVARDGGIRAMLTGRVEKLDSTYILSVAVVNPANGVTVASLSEEAVGHQQLVPAISQLAIVVRETLGEEMGQLEPSAQKLEKATTPSLRALQLYSQGRALVDSETAQEEWGPAAELFRQAVAEDPDFASAHVWLAFGLWNLYKRDESPLHFQRAYELADTTTGHEKYFILGSYYWMYLKDLGKAAEVFEVAVKSYPDDYWSTVKLAEIYFQLGRSKERAALNARVADLRPNDWRANCRAARSRAVAARSFDDAQPYLDRTRALLASGELSVGRPFCAAWVELLPAHQYWLRGDVEKTLDEANRLRQTLDSLDRGERESLAQLLSNLYWTLGKLEAAEEVHQVKDPAWRVLTLMEFALDRNDRHRVKKLLGSGPVPQFPSSAVVLARAGLLSEAEQLIRSLERKKFSPEWQLHWARAELALARGQPRKAVASFHEAARVQPIRPDYPVLFYETTFAQAYEQNGDLPKAIQILEDASKEKTWGAVWGVNIPMLWMQWQAELARLYRKAGRREEAQKIEAELSKLLVYADADHPIARQLKESRALSVQRR